MKYLLDTRVLLWARTAEQKLNDRAKRILGDPVADLCLSAVCVWEISVKFALRTLKLPVPPAEFIRNTLQTWNLRSISITHDHALAAGELPLHHRDPFDRMLIAQARTEGMTLLTTDPAIAKYDVTSIYCGK
jgi:PIN domain nuclease of toxin-antitoxin system